MQYNPNGLPNKPLDTQAPTTTPTYFKDSDGTEEGTILHAQFLNELVDNIATIMAQAGIDITAGRKEDIYDAIVKIATNTVNNTSRNWEDLT